MFAYADKTLSANVFRWKCKKYLYMIVKTLIEEHMTHIYGSLKESIMKTNKYESTWGKPLS